MPLASPPGRPDVVYGFGRIDASGPVMQQARDEARRRKIALIVLPTAEATGVLTGAAADTIRHPEPKKPATRTKQAGQPTGKRSN